MSAVRLVEDLRRVPDQLSAAGTSARCVVPPIAEELTTAGGFVFVGRGTGLPYAAEGALKLKELTYRWAEHYPAGELKHGPLALISTGTPVVVIDNAHPKLGATVAEVQARGGRIIGHRSGAGSTVPVVDSPHAPWGPLADRRSAADSWPGHSRWLWAATSTNPAIWPNQVTVEYSDEPRERHLNHAFYCRAGRRHPAQSAGCAPLSSPSRPH